VGTGGGKADSLDDKRDALQVNAKIDGAENAFIFWHFAVCLYQLTIPEKRKWGAQDLRGA
jgi:hypothetical protein